MPNAWPSQLSADSAAARPSPGPPVAHYIVLKFVWITISLIVPVLATTVIRPGFYADDGGSQHTGFRGSSTIRSARRRTMRPFLVWIHDATPAYTERRG